MSHGQIMTGPGETRSLPRSPSCLSEVAVVLVCVPEAMGCGLGAWGTWREEGMFGDSC